MRRALALLAILGCAAAVAGQRAIALREGAGEIEGRLRGLHHHSYSLDLEAEALAVEMTVHPIRSATVELYDPDGARVMLVKEGAGRWIAALPKPGRYVLVVGRVVRGGPPSSYHLRVSTR